MPTVKYEVDKNGYLETFEVEGKQVPKRFLKFSGNVELSFQKNFPLQVW